MKILESLSTIESFLGKYWYKNATANLLIALACIPMTAIFSSISKLFTDDLQHPAYYVSWYLLLLFASIKLRQLGIGDLQPTKGKKGVIFAIVFDSPEDEKKVRADFLEKVQTSIKLGGEHTKLQPVFLSNTYSEYIISLDSREKESFLDKHSSIFLAFGRVKSRTEDGKNGYVLDLNYMVKHAPTTNHNRNLLLQDFQAIPRQGTIFQNNQVSNFYLLSQEFVPALYFVIGISALITCDYEHSEILFLKAQQKVNSIIDSIRKHKQKARHSLYYLYCVLPNRIANLYVNELMRLIGKAYESWSPELFQQAEKVATKLNIARKNDATALNTFAICRFILHRDVKSAISLIKKIPVNSHPDSAALKNYSLAFLYAYKFDYAQAKTHYTKAFRYQASHVAESTKLFIDHVMREEPDRQDLHYCLGLIYGNENALNDTSVSEYEYSQFLASVPNFSAQTREKLNIQIENASEKLARDTNQ